MNIRHTSNPRSQRPWGRADFGSADIVSFRDNGVHVRGGDPEFPHVAKSSKQAWRARPVEPRPVRREELPSRCMEGRNR